MASAGSIDPHNIQTLVAKTKTLINAQLKSVLRAESLPVSGAKAVMQERIINLRESTRDNLDCKINLRQDTVDRLSKDSSLKVMVYCASEPMSPFNQVDISFPHSIEIRINLDEIKSNLRGLKNKPGSTRPADITPLLRKRAGYDNSMRITYALTNKKFYILVNLVKQHQPEDLVAKLNKRISKEQVIHESRYVNDILKCTPRSTEQVTIEPDGKWSEVVQKESVGRSNGAHSSSDEDDDLIEIQDMPRVSAIKDEALLTPSSMARTPPHSSREQSFSSAAPRSISSKRPMSQVIDLTFSSDEEDQPSRGPKRQTTQPTSTGYLHSYISSGMLSENTPPRPNGINFNIPKLAPTRQPEPLDHGFGSS
ncbi:SUMO ligase siz1 [Ptychographa xylographoides]|nr:SUMO ligase siz1 [Ptychographa xylographoides]